LPWAFFIDEKECTMFTNISKTQDLVALLLFRDASGRSTIVETPQCPARHPSPTLAALGNEAIRWVFQHNRPLVLDNGVGILSRMQGVLDKAGLQSAAILPLTSRECPIGVVVIGSRIGPTPFAAMDPPSMTLLGHLLSDTFEQLRLFKVKRANESGQPNDSPGNTRANVKIE
jgi:hypothetical protein